MAKTVLTLGELMMRLTPPRKLRIRQTSQFDICHGGAEANVANALASFGLNSRFISALPDTELGTHALSTLNANGVDTTHVHRSAGRMGLYFLEEGADHRSGCVIYDRDQTAFSHLKFDDIDWDAAFEGADWFHISGITAAISANTLKLAQASIDEAQRRGVHISIDLNYRDRLWAYGVAPQEVMPDMVAKADTLIAGRGDCEPCLGINGDGDNGSNVWARSLSESLQGQFPNLSNIAVTVRSSVSADKHDWYAFLKSPAGEFFSRAYTMQNIVDRVGTGDAFSAGLIYGLLMKPIPEASLNFAAAANCLKHTIIGDANCVTVEEIDALAATSSFGRLKR